MKHQLNTEMPAVKLYDLCFIENICRNNPDRVRILLQTFISTMPVAIEQIKNAHQRLEFSIIKQTAHKIKPVLSFYAIITLEKDINTIERLAQEEANTSELLFKIQKLDAVISQVVTDIKSNFLNN